MTPMPSAELTTDQLLAILRQMLLIREFEGVSTELSRRGKIPSGVHSAAGQEAVAIGAISALEPSDIVCSSHRSHHHALAKGLSPRRIMAELFGKATGCLGGRGGHMHLADFSIGLYGSNGIVGGGLGIALGASLGAHLRQTGQLAVAFFGDGAANTGRVWEFINLASLWKLPLIAVCENNLYALETPIEMALAAESVSQRASGFGLPVETVDGQEVGQVLAAVRTAARRARGGDGPTFIEALTYRFDGHNFRDPETYRTVSEVEEWRQTGDPILRVRRVLAQHNALSDSDYQIVLDEAASVVADAVQFAEDSPWPDPGSAAGGVVGWVAQEVISS